MDGLFPNLDVGRLLFGLGPEIGLIIGGLLFLMFGIVAKQPGQKKMVGWMCALLFIIEGVFLTGMLRTQMAEGPGDAGFLANIHGNPALVVDGFAIVMKLILVMAGLMTVFLMMRYMDMEKGHSGELYSFLCFSVFGMMIMASANDMIGLYVGLETMAMAIYVLVAYHRRKSKSVEGAMKYFVLGAFASAFLLYGASLLYGATGTINLMEMGTQLQHMAATGTFTFPALFGVLIFGSAMLFKVAAVPFHMWSPDAYQGAPTPVTAFMSTAAKAAALAMFIRVFLVGLMPLGDHWITFLGLAAALTMVVGNVAAIKQTNIKRLLAYSSIAHAGYMLLGLVAAGADPSLTSEAVQAVVFYLVVYTFMNMGAFAIVLSLKQDGKEGDELSDFKGLGRAKPLLGVVMLVLMLSLAGIPPTAGFLGKFYLFAVALKAGSTMIVWLTVLGVLTSVISLYYYFRVVYYMFLTEDETSGESTMDLGLKVVLAVSFIFTLGALLFMGPMDAVTESGSQLQPRAVPAEIQAVTR